jgi:hypothetical protein
MLSFLKKTTQYFFTITTFLFLLSSVSNAQTSDIYITISPNNPRVGESVTLSINSSVIDLNSSKIIWYIDGSPRRETSSQNITIKTKNDGSKTLVKVVVETIDGIIKETSTEISPAGVDLIIEPISYVPPFYKGKPNFTPQSTIKIIAIPDITIGGIKIKTKDLNFRWFIDNIASGNNSGKGKNSIAINGKIPIKDINVSLNILDDSGLTLTQFSKTIKVEDPIVLLYENHPLYGLLYNKAITDEYFLGTREELKITAKPYYFNFTSKSNLNFLWYINDTYILPDADKTDEIILKQTTSNLPGVANISLNLKNKVNIFQYAKENINITFGL